VTDILRTISDVESVSRTRNYTSFSSIRRDLEDSVRSMYRVSSVKLHYLPTMVLFILWVSGIHSMRISELLELTVDDDLEQGRFIIKGRKRSRSYTVYIPELIPIVKELKTTANDRRVFRCDYKWIWEWCRRCGVGFTPEGHVNCARTHAHRYQTAERVSSRAGNTAAGDVLHHRSRSSVDYYLPKKRGSHGKNQ
jgi:integrase